MSDFAPDTNEGFIRNSTKEIARLKRHANGGIARDATGRQYIGIVTPGWTSGKVTVAVTGIGTVSAFLSGGDLDIQAGATVLLTRFPGDVWIVVSAVASGPTYLREVPLVLNAAGGWVQYDDKPGSFNFNTTQAIAGDAFSPATATRSETGWVIVYGLIYKATGTSGTPIKIATLPEGMWPEFPAYFAAMNQSDSQAFTVEVRTNGEIWSTAAGLNAGYISLANIVFNNGLTYTPLTYSGTWAPFGAGTRPASIAKDPYGLVALAGTAKAGANTNGSVIGVVPALAAPLYQNYMGAAVNGALGALVILGTNNLGQYSILGNVRKDLDGAFYSASTAPAYQPIIGLNGWTALGGPYPPLAYYKRPDGLVHVRGMIQAGPAGVPCGRLPEGCRPRRKILIGSMSADLVATYQITWDGNIAIRTGTTPWFMINALFAPDH